MPTIELPNDELQAVIAALRRVIEEDRYPLSPRLDPLKAALARLEAERTSTPKPLSPAWTRRLLLRPRRTSAVGGKAEPLAMMAEGGPTKPVRTA